MSEEVIERSFEVGSPAVLKLGNIRGSIDVKPGEDGIVSIKAVKHPKTGNDDLTEIRMDQEEDGRVVVKTEYTNSVESWFGARKPCKVDYTVHIPKECCVKVSGVSCPIAFKELSGSFDITSVSGKITLKDLSNEIKISSVSGAIEAERLEGRLESNSVSGRTRVMDSNLSTAYVKTVSGKMVLQTPLSEGPYTFKGVSGSAILVVPEDTACTANFHSVSGRMRTSLPITKDNRRRSRGTLEIQGGGVAVSCKCVSGGLKIVTSENETIVEKKVVPTEGEAVSEQKVVTENPVPAVNRIETLKKIERGEISVDEAIKELNA